MVVKRWWRAFGDAAAARRGEACRRTWEARWARDDYSPAWARRGVAREIIDAASSGWLPPSGRVLDIGCGLGELACWFSARGYAAKGIDIAPSAVARARRRAAAMAEPPRFDVLDICATTPTGGPFDIVIDRSCLHQLGRRQVRRYAAHVGEASAPGARMLLFLRAFRDGVPFGEAREAARRQRWVRRALRGVFDIERAEPTWLDDAAEAEPARRLGGMVVWMRRRGGAARPRR